MGKFLFFIKVNIRNLFTNRKFTWINIIGLSVGVTISLLILMYVRYETSFDSFNTNTGNIYRVLTGNLQDGTVSATTPLALSDVLKKDYPELDKVVSLMGAYFDLKTGQERFDNLKGAIVEKKFFSLFGFPLISGNLAELFNSPYEAVVTIKTAEKMYGTTDVLGKTFEMNNSVFKITGVINTMPSNSTLNYDYFLSDTYRYLAFPDLKDRWYHFGLRTYVTFKAGKEPAGFEQKLKSIEATYYPDFMKGRNKYIIKPFKGSHLDATVADNEIPPVNPLYLWLLSAIALGILVIACLNFMNITTADASRRSVETAIKKVSGASPGMLVGDLMAEISFLVFISLMISFLGVYLLMPLFDRLIEKDITVNLSDPVLWTGIICFGILSVCIAGLYPSVKLSKPSPVKVLLQKRTDERHRLTFRKSFVILQFTLTVILAIVQVFIIKQIGFMKNHDTGFSRNNLITIPVRSVGNTGEERMKNTNLFVQELEKYQSQYGYGIPTITEFVPGFGFRNLFKIYPDGQGFEDGMELLSCDVDQNFPEVFGMKIIRGRFFSKEYPTDADALVINETAWKKFGWHSLENKSIGLIWKENRKHVIGVINDINVKSLQYPVQPMIYQFGRHHNYPGYVTLRIDPARKKETIDFIKSQWAGLFSGVPFSFEDVDAKYMSFYGDEIRLSRITGVFSMLAIFLSLLGIFALSRLATDRRIKEIGIRRINGAKAKQVVAMFNKDFLNLVILACVIGFPVSWYSTNRWLNHFAYKTQLSWWVFALSGIIVISLALLTVSLQSWRAARKNPVEALRYE
ncbi:MAG TPA: ABC transporter permease [Bacteroidales bacterium]|nr:ABC transporter permease [Bacteroidales bacterium]